MRKNVRYFGEYKGFKFEIQNWDFGDGKLDKWCGYVLFTKDNTDEELFNHLLELKVGNYSLEYTSCWLNDLEWHGGLTFVEHQRTHKAEVYAVKAGCDYQHYWDQGYTYDEKDVERDLRCTIDSYLDYVKQ